MNPKVYEHKTLNYKGKPVFSKLVIGEFGRIEKYFQENEACFMFIDNGDFILRTPLKTTRLQSGDGFFAKCGNYFFENKLVKTIPEQKTELIAAYFYPEVVSDLFDENIFESNFKTNYDANKYVIDQFMINFKDSISFMIDNPSMMDDTLLLSKLKEFIILLAKTENAPSLADFVSSFFKPLEYDFKAIIKSNLYASLSLSELAMLCGMSLSTFKRHFSEYYSESPKKYILSKKIEKAKQNLRIKENRITDIAYDCGFETLTTFNKNFKLIVGQSPSEFRKL